ncbi:MULTISPECIES: hypothetical protein [Burkholderia]|uniref:Uncharacterized protein n=1 Tax=Burkholderia glumae TaxID=337 RepID=A0AAQ0BV94_BURGL|nr:MULTISPECIES: hypothetical protein [Burkholderia]ACR29166.1 Hypothetical protein bglu_1g20600 [Burkholderia glumae BGR1]AJY67772.1 hypothetical protein KS03_2929 [Burkholderia glumae LMG 2196 = ATCC 33617]PNL01281.1 hypothetical protein CEQ24_019895 [Burkholderia glumae]QPQ93202.1 hypothetical protein I6H06_13035 [Burkholderia glumae]QQM91595.1 hypothetical protein I6G78_04715 [Burkholderia glumae]
MSEPTKPDEKKARFRKIQVRMWGDEKFRELTPIPPCGAGLWVYLLTGPHTGPIPGIFRSGRAAMAEELDWDQEAFDEAFREVFQQGMAKADWKAKVVWIPKAIACNLPESPNVVKSWGSEWELIPECDLKREAYESLRANICGRGEAFAKAFHETFDKPSPKPSGKPSPKAIGNQEQEQEQEKKTGANAPVPSAADATPATPVAAEPAGPAGAAEPDGPNRDLLGDGDSDADAGGKGARRKPAELPCPVERIVEAYHELMPLNPRVRLLNAKRRRAIAARWREAATLTCKPFGYSTVEAGMQAWCRFFRVCADSDFLTGKAKPRPGQPPFLADIDFLISPDGFTKCLEDKYHREAS